MHQSAAKFTLARQGGQQRKEQMNIYVTRCRPILTCSLACVNNQPLDSLETADRSEREQPKKTECSRSFDHSSPRQESHEPRQRHKHKQAVVRIDNTLYIYIYNTKHCCLIPAQSTLWIKNPRLLFSAYLNPSNTYI